MSQQQILHKLFQVKEQVRATQIVRKATETANAVEVKAMKAGG
jgi:hypothetical protein